jgi:HPt (histidine-containing phosphotransfer) domain-containing protein
VNYLKIEEDAHAIKELFGQLEAQELKDIAFKIELSARRCNNSGIVNNLKLLQEKYSVIKKLSNNGEEELQCLKY